MRRLPRQLICVCVALALGAGTAQASPSIRSPLPGFPRIRGVIPVRGSTAGIVARDRAIETALWKLPKASSINPTPDCTKASTNPGADLCWRGGPVVGAHRVHLIFWEGKNPPKPFTLEYQRTIKTYFENVARDNGASSNIYSVAALYGDGEASGAYDVSSVDVYLDTTDELPPSGKAVEKKCIDSAAAESVCITDAALQGEVETARKANPGWEAGLKDIYFVFTPPSVGGCFEPGSDTTGDSCAFSSSGSGYCAYHSDFGPEGKKVLYADIPDGVGIEGCDSFEYPEGVGNVDAVLDTASHEDVETITDPLGNGWVDQIGQEIADKCLPPETFEVYGGPLGGTPATKGESGTLFNQSIGGQDYWLQTAWSNSAGASQGGCVQRVVNAAFESPSGGRASTPVTFSGAPSGSPGDPVDYWVWDFGDRMQLGTPAATASHTYAEPGEYRVTLTAVDAQGNTNTVTHTVIVGAPLPPPSAPLPPPSPLAILHTITVKEPAPALEHLTAAQLAAKLGLPASGTTLSGSGTIALGHGECPPACGVTLNLYASVATAGHGHRRVRRERIGSLHMTIAAGGTGGLALTLDAAGRALLRHAHRLKVTLRVAVEGREGGVWQIAHSLTLTGSGRATRERG